MPPNAINASPQDLNIGVANLAKCPIAAAAATTAASSATASAGADFTGDRSLFLNE